MGVFADNGMTRVVEKKEISVSVFREEKGRKDPTERR